LAKAAWRLHRYPFHVQDEIIADLLRKAVLSSGRKPKGDEIPRAIWFTHPSNPNNIRRKFKAASPAHSPGPKKSSGRKCRRISDIPEFGRNPQLEEESIKGHPEGVYNLVELSEVRDPWDLHSTEILRHLFPADLPLAWDYTKYQNFTAPLNDPRFRDYVPQFIVPSLPIGEYGITSEGEKSARALENIGRRWYLVTDFDDGRTLHQQAARILWLTREARRSGLELVLVVFSGKKSLHAWWKCRHLPEPLIMQFFQVAYAVGCDEATKTRNQLVRTPNAIRVETACKQYTYFCKECKFNENTNEK
jgi:hypothetical protein